MGEPRRFVEHSYSAVGNWHTWTLVEDEELMQADMACQGDRAVNETCDCADLVTSYLRSMAARIDQENTDG